MRSLQIVQLHCIPYANVNAGIDGSPKTIIFENTLRSFISSQSCKRAIKEMFKHLAKRALTVYENAYMHALLRDRVPQEKIQGEIESAFKDIEYMLDKPKSLEKRKFTNPIVNAFFGHPTNFERDFAEASACTHLGAFSTNAAEMKEDIFVQKDDRKRHANYVNYIRASSGIFYSFVTLNLSLLKKHLNFLPQDEYIAYILDFIASAYYAFPNAKASSMLVRDYPAYTLIYLQDHGQVIDLSSAYRVPIPQSTHMLDDAIEALETQFKKTKENGWIETAYETRISAQAELEQKIDLLRDVL